MTDAELLHRFRTSSFLPGTLTHEGHVRLAWLLLRERPLPEALAELTVGLRAFAKSVGKEEIYHETVTCGLLLAIHARIARDGPGEGSAEFFAAYPELVEWKALLGKWWSDDALWSDAARAVFVMPDKVTAI